MKRNGELRAGTGRALTLGLFYETTPNSKATASYTTKPKDLVKDGLTFISLKRLYLECLDPTEETFVQLAFDGNHRQWEMVKASPHISERMSKSRAREGQWVEEWKEDLTRRVQSFGIEAIKNEVTSGGKSSYSAAKWLAERGWEEKKGRPTKLAVEKERKIQASIVKDVNDDYDRMEGLGLSVIDGDKD